MEYVCGRSLTGAENCVVELKSIYVWGTLVMYLYCVITWHIPLYLMDIMTGD